VTQLIESIMGEAGDTFRVAADDTSNSLVDDGGLVMLGTAPTSRGGQRVVQAVLITCESNPIRIAFSTDADQTGSAEVGHELAVGASILVSNPKNIRSLRYINKTNGSNGVMQITPFYVNN